MDYVNGILIYELSEKAFERYKKVTIKNKNITYDTARRKLTRSIMLGKSVYWDEKNKFEIILYGSLKIRINVHDDGTEKIVNIWNHRTPDPYWILHKKDYRKISKKLGLEVNR